MPWYWKRSTSTEKEGYGETELMWYASRMLSYIKRKHYHRLLCRSHSWQAVLPARVSQLALTGSAVNPDVTNEAISWWSWQPRGKTLATADALSRSPLPKARAWLIVELTAGLLGVCYQPQIKSWLKPAQQSRLMKHDQRSSALQDT